MPKRKSRRIKKKIKKEKFGGYKIYPDEALKEVIGNKPLSPSEMTKKVWNYIKSKKLSAKETKHVKKKTFKRAIKHNPRHAIRKAYAKKKILRKISKRKFVKVKHHPKTKIIKKEVSKPIIGRVESFLEKITPKIESKKEAPAEKPAEEFRESITEKPPKKQLIVSFPEGNSGIKYSLIEPFAYADIKWHEKEKEFVYNLIEPILTDEEKRTYEKIVSGLMEILDVELSSVKKKEEALNYLEEQTKKVLEEYEIKPTQESFLKILYFIQRNFVGLNELEPLMQDPYIEDISCDGVGIPIYVIHRRYGSIKTDIAFADAKKLKEFVVKLAERCGRFISYAEPLLDGTLPDGSRVQATYASDVTTRGPSITIRKFVQEPFSPIDLLNKKTVNSDTLAYLWMAVENGASILIAGGVGTGKTTMLNSLLMFVPNEAKIISIEDTRELNLSHENWVPSVTRVGFAKGYGEVTMFDLLKEAFRQTPDYVIVGEVRGVEAYVMFQGMASGIPAMGTMHAGRVEDVVYRLQTPPISLSPALIDTLDLVLIMIHTREKGEAARRMKEIVEIESVDQTSGKARTNQVYHWDANEDTYEYNGTSYFLQEIAAHKGVQVTELIKELEARKKILDWMQKNNIIHFKEVVEVLTNYRKSPEKVLKDAGIQV
jgi:flagellar protein FlaI